MFFETDVRPQDPFAEVTFLGDKPEVVTPEFGDDNWEFIATVKAEKLTMEGEWWYSTEFTKEIDPLVEGFWMWGDVLVRVIPATILETGLYVFKRKGADHEQ
jgi:hypothetical protein